MPWIYDQLRIAQAENLSSAPSAGVRGRFYWDTTELRLKVDNGTAYVAILANDGKLVIGTSGTANNNVRANRAANSVLQFVLGGDTTAEGSFSANFAQLSFKVESYATGSLPSAGSAGRLLYDTTVNLPKYDNGSAIKTLADIDSTQTLSAKTLDTPTLSSYAVFTHTATPSAAASNTNRVYVKAGNTLNWIDSGGVEHTASESSSVDPRNFIINGNFDFWQRATSSASIAANTFTADRFYYYKSGTVTVVHTVSRSTDVPTLAESGFQSSYSVLIDCTTADADDPVAAGDLIYYQTVLEGYQYAQLKSRQITLSFWVKATKTGTYCVGFRNNGQDRSYVAEYTVSASDTWEKKTITLTVNPTGGTDDFTNGGAFRISWALMAGSTFHTTAGSWQTGDFVATSNQVNAGDNVANNFRLAQVMLNFGSSALGFTRAGWSLGNELTLCKRYYEKSYDVGTAPATNTAVGGARAPAAASSATAAEGSAEKFMVEKRFAPSMTFYKEDGSNSNWIWNDGSGNQNATPSPSRISNSGFAYDQTGLTGLTTGRAVRVYGHWTADSEI